MNKYWVEESLYVIHMGVFAHENMPGPLKFIFKLCAPEDDLERRSGRAILERLKELQEQRAHTLAAHVAVAAAEARVNRHIRREPTEADVEQVSSEVEPPSEQERADARKRERLACDEAHSLVIRMSHYKRSTTDAAPIEAFKELLESINALPDHHPPDLCQRITELVIERLSQ